ncbi:DUF4184 family protein [Rathayibacter sp. Leaf296]|uniref:DUF4184 family protein n=1 Tax=Rathayibacter sp. Leaf296 TaxID=1736327 RepID=UPI000702AEFB|nr:DUF4184 family protein [Rathayibacter sp. Leaf296]KQQ08785.1 hypothetical protein ASF46_16220 [Rathayibacter sp. Leaf296]
MPFTPSHAVVALAFRNGRIPASAVASGAVMPDLGMYLPWEGARSATHSLLGVVTVDLALGAVGLALWIVLLEPAWRDLAPRIVRMRFRPRRSRPRGARAWVTALLLTAAGIVIGAATHVVWDAFTHLSGAGVVAIPALERDLGPFPVYKWLQYGSGVLGLVGLGIGAVVWYVSHRPRPLAPDGRTAVRLAAWSVVLAAAVVPVGIVLAVAGFDPLAPEYRSSVVDAAILTVICTGGAALAIALLHRLVVSPAPHLPAGGDPS